jgi:divalent metal cation (Fe/Co/Zn/Cd) transporter
MRDRIIAVVVAIVVFAGGFLLGRETAPSLLDQMVEIAEESDQVRETFDEISSGLD